MDFQGMPRLRTLLGVLALLIASAMVAHADILHVNAIATGANTGASWADAFTDLQSALAAAQAGDEIWVAAGTYTPTPGTDRTISFVMKEGVGIYGGFAGTETARDERDWEANETILSGDIGVGGEDEDNSGHVVVGADGAVLDGVTVMLGYANLPSQSNLDYGGGMLNESVSPVIANCTFRNNFAEEGGGGMYCSNGSPNVSDCVFIDNVVEPGGFAGIGGGMYNVNSLAVISRCVYRDNHVLTEIGIGGGVANEGGSVSIANCIFSDNSASLGAGLSNGAGSSNVRNCTFISNKAISGYANRGGGIANASAQSTIVNCSFIENESYYGGGVANMEALVTMINCIFSDNTTAVMGHAMSNSSSSPKIIHCTFGGRSVQFSALIYNEESSPEFTNCVLWSSAFPTVFNLKNSSPSFSHCVIQGGGGSLNWNPGLGIDHGGNIISNPRLVSTSEPAGRDGILSSDDGFNLTAHSPCIDAGIAIDLAELDILGLPRVRTPDIGAYEFQDEPAPPRPPGILYVKSGAAGSKTGESWENAFDDLHEALAVTRAGDEVWVATGIYKPTSGADRTVSFLLSEDVALYGGFAGNEVLLEERNWETNKTILSGDIGEPVNIADNSHRVVYGAELAILDGFTVRDGNDSDSDADDPRGAGCSINGISVSIVNCIFRGNSGRGSIGIRGPMSRIRELETGTMVRQCSFIENSSGGISAHTARFDVEDCTFNMNTKSGIAGTQCKIHVTRCLFLQNSADSGGGMFLPIGNDASVTDSSFLENTAHSNGGGIAGYSRVESCQFIKNSAQHGGGYYGLSHFVNCNFVANRAESGGGVFIFGVITGNRSMSNCILWNNSSKMGSQVYEFSFSSPITIYRNCLIEGSGGSGPTWPAELGFDLGGNIDADPLFMDPDNPAGPDGVWMTDDDGLALLPGSPCIDAGTAEDAPATDILGHPRGPAPDIGAYEYLSTESRATHWSLYR